MQSQTESHPIHQWINKAKINQTSKVIHLSPLETILKHFRNATREIEYIKSCIKLLWWNSTGRIIVAGSKEIVKHNHEKQVKKQRRRTIHIYTDGSRIDNYIRAAIYNQTLNQSEQQRLRHQLRYNIYGAKLWTINMAISYQTRITNLYFICCIYCQWSRHRLRRFRSLLKFRCCKLKKIYASHANFIHSGPSLVLLPSATFLYNLSLQPPSTTGRTWFDRVVHQVGHGSSKCRPRWDTFGLALHQV